MGTVTSIASLIPSDICSILNSVDTIDIINIAVAIVILAIVRNLIWVYPHIGKQIGMRVLNTLVNDCNDNLRVTSCVLPSSLSTDILASLSILEGYSSVVDIVPLLVQHRVVERATCSTGHSHLVSWNCCNLWAVNSGIKLYTRDLRHLSILCCRTLDIHLLVELHDKPTVHTARDLLLSVDAHIKQRLDRLCTKLRSNLVKSAITATSSLRSGSPRLGSSIVDIQKELAIDSTLRTIHKL